MMQHGSNATLDELGLKYGTDKASTGHGYLGHYERHLGYLRDRDDVMLMEIGVWHGDSIRMWADWLPITRVVGVDIDISKAGEMPPNVRLVQCDARTLDIMPQTLDVLIDDGSHMADDIHETLNKHWAAVKPGGWLIVEDWATQWQPTYGGAWNGSLATREAHHFLDMALLPEFAVAELHAYTELLFIRRSP